VQPENLHAAAVTVLLAYTVFRDTINVPALEVSFDDKRDLKNQTHTVGFPPNAITPWLRIRVRNTHGQKAAKNCRAYLVRAVRLLPAEPWRTFLQTTVGSCVGCMTRSSMDPSHIDLLPGVGNSVDIAATSDQSQGLYIQCAPKFSLNEPGDYMMSIQISAEDAELPEIVSIKRSWLGGWASLGGKWFGSIKG
jgi:hypothetical protein